MVDSGGNLRTKNFFRRVLRFRVEEVCTFEIPVMRSSFNGVYGLICNKTNLADHGIDSKWNFSPWSASISVKVRSASRATDGLV